MTRFRVGAGKANALSNRGRAFSKKISAVIPGKPANQIERSLRYSVLCKMRTSSFSWSTLFRQLAVSISARNRFAHFVGAGDDHICKHVARLAAWRAIFKHIRRFKDVGVQCVHHHPKRNDSIQSGAALRASVSGISSATLPFSGGLPVIRAMNKICWPLASATIIVTQDGRFLRLSVQPSSFSQYRRK